MDYNASTARTLFDCSYFVTERKLELTGRNEKAHYCAPADYGAEITATQPDQTHDHAVHLHGLQPKASRRDRADAGVPVGNPRGSGNDMK